MAEIAAGNAATRAGGSGSSELPQPTIPYARHEIDAGDIDAVLGALRGERLTQGVEPERFERALCDRLGAANAVAVSSGTAALHVALAAFGVRPGDEVIVPTLTFAATANAVRLCGADPVFADVDPVTLTLDPADLARRVTPRTRGAIPVHFAGHPADVAEIRAVLPEGAFVLEDACHALGASRDGRPAGTLGEAACFSFHPAKHVTTGEGGAVTTGSPVVAERCRRLREHGIERDPARFEGLDLPPALRAEEVGGWVYELHALSPNYRMPDLNAALGRSQLQRLPGFLARRRALADAYTEALSDLEGVTLPVELPGARSAWHLFALRIEPDRFRGGRAALHRRLHARGIGVQVHYVPVHLHPYYRRTAGTRFGDLPVAERAYLGLLSLPLFSSMADSDLMRVVETLRDELRRARR